MENKFKIKNINIEFQDEYENVSINFDDGEFIKIKDTEFGKESHYEDEDEDGDSIWYKELYSQSDCGLKLKQFSELDSYFSIFIDLDKLHSDIEISIGLLTILKKIDEENKIKKKEEERKEKERLKNEEEQNRIWNLKMDKNKETFLNYINFLRKENLTKEINIIYHYWATGELSNNSSQSFICDFGGWNTKNSRAKCREKVKNLIIDNAKTRGFDLSFYTYNIRRQDFKEIIKINPEEFFKKYFFEYNFKTSMVGDGHNQHWVITNIEINQGVKSYDQN